MNQIVLQIFDLSRNLTANRSRGFAAPCKSWRAKRAGHFAGLRLMGEVT